MPNEVSLSSGEPRDQYPRLQRLLSYDPSRLSIPRPSLDIVLAAGRFIQKKAEDLEKRDMRSAPVYLNEVVACLRTNEAPTRKAIRRVAAGSLPDLIARPDGKSLLARFIEIVISLGSKTVYKALLLGFLRLSHKDSIISEVLRLALLKGVDELPQRWQERISRFGLLETPIAKKLASVAMSPHAENPIQVFEEAGLKRGILLSGGFAVLAFEHICDELSRGHDPQSLRRFLTLFPPSLSAIDDERVQLTQTALPHVARALLRPYLQADPDEDSKGAILDLLVRLYKDPRLNPTGWASVDQDLISVLLRWLTAESFEMLMEVLTSSNQSQQWKTREAFWKKFFKRDLVREAWVAFGPDAAREAQALVRRGVLRSRGAFGVLEKSQIQGHHSVLFMRIGDLTISEWTHDGKVRFYRSRNADKPRFYQLRYDPEVIRRDSKADHYKVHLGSWQFDVADYVHTVTGLRV